MFKYDPKKLPYVKVETEYGDGNAFKVGDWSLDIRDEYDIANAERAIYTWIAWYEFLVRRSQDGTEAQG
jgi:hypothetical protein